MSRTVQGVAAVLHTPMRGKPVKFGVPGPFPVYEGAPVMHQRARVGVVQALWVEEDRVHWIGLMDDPPLRYEDVPPEMTIPLPEPTARDLVSASRLVGVPALTEARTEREGEFMVLVGWTVCRMELLTTEAAPWAGLTLSVR